MEQLRRFASRCRLVRAAAIWLVAGVALACGEKAMAQCASLAMNKEQVTTLFQKRYAAEVKGLVVSLESIACKPAIGSHLAMFRLNTPISWSRTRAIYTVVLGVPLAPKGGMLRRSSVLDTQMRGVSNVRKLIREFERDRRSREFVKRVRNRFGVSTPVVRLGQSKADCVSAHGKKRIGGSNPKVASILYCKGQGVVEYTVDSEASWPGRELDALRRYVRLQFEGRDWQWMTLSRRSRSTVNAAWIARGLLKTDSGSEPTHIHAFQNHLGEWRLSRRATE